MFLILRPRSSGMGAQPSDETTQPNVPRLKFATGCLRKCKSNILSSFSQGVRGADRLREVRSEMRSNGGHAEETALHAPAVALGMLERALHLFAEDFCEN
jgi:hypothetical protein